MEKLVSMIAEMGLPFAYDHFIEGESPEPPFLCYLIPGSDNFAGEGVPQGHKRPHGSLYG